MLAVKAVEGDAEKAVGYGPMHQFMDAVEGWIGALEAAGEIDVGVDYTALEVFDVDRAVAFDLNVAHGVVSEARFVALTLGVAFEDVDVDLVAFFVGAGAGAVAKVELAGFLIDEAAFFEALAGVLDRYRRAAFALQPQFGPAAEKLTEIVDVCAVPGLGDVYRLQLLVDADGRHDLRHHCAAGGILVHGRFPVGVVEAV